jgi:hypothetical protein
MTVPSNAPAYEKDFVAWLEDQARHARRGETDALDLDNIAEELEGMARSDRREIRNRLTVLLGICSNAGCARAAGLQVGLRRSPNSAFRSRSFWKTARACEATPRKSSTAIIRRPAATLRGKCGCPKAVFPSIARSRLGRSSIRLGFRPLGRNKPRAMHKLPLVVH